MSTGPTTCPKCQGKMVQGFLVDFAYAAALVTTWIEGSPTKSFLPGIKPPKKYKRIPVGTYRCSACGYLESYASAGFGPR